MESKLGIKTYRMFLRMALIESDFGTNVQTFNKNFIDHTGLHSIGIWQITKMALEETQNNPNLQNHRDKIQAVFGINWQDVSMNDMRRPLHCFLAAYLYIKFAEKAWPHDAVVGWPEDLENQATKWKKHFNRNSGGLSEQGFITRCNNAGV
jgi:hypothetical protein